MLKNLILSAWVLVFLLACGPSTDQTPAEKTVPSSSKSSSDGLQGVYEGTLPCADCEGIRTRLVLRANGTFELEETYMGQNNRTFAHKGKWQPREDGLSFAIHYDQPEEVRYYKLINEHQIRVLNRSGHEFRTRLNYTLRKQ